MAELIDVSGEAGGGVIEVFVWDFNGTTYTLLGGTPVVHVFPSPTSGTPNPNYNLVVDYTGPVNPDGSPADTIVVTVGACVTTCIRGADMLGALPSSPL